MSRRALKSCDSSYAEGRLFGHDLTRAFGQESRSFQRKQWPCQVLWGQFKDLILPTPSYEIYMGNLATVSTHSTGKADAVLN